MTETHPMQRSRGYLVLTGPIKAAMMALTQSLVLGEAGMVCIAPPRHGKTTMLVHAEKAFRTASSAVMLRSKLISSAEKNSVPKFWRRLMGLQEGGPASLTMQQPYQALLNLVRTECDKMGVDTVVFAIDEAQNLRFGELDMLKVLSEDLIDLGFHPYVYLVGQPQFELLIARLRRARRQDLIQRFMLRTHNFEGLRSDDVRSVFRHIDTATWPEGSGITYTQHFVPGLWSQGWRMAEQAEPFWHAFEGLARRLSVEPSTLQVGAQFVTAGAVKVLLELAAKPSLRDTHELFSTAVEKSGFPESLRVDKADVKEAARWANGFRTER